MATPLHSSDWLTDKNTLVQLVPKNEEAQAILWNSSNMWTIRPMPKQLKQPQFDEITFGWLLLRSMNHQQRFVHILHDRFFDVVFVTHDNPKKEMIMVTTDFTYNALMTRKMRWALEADGIMRHVNVCAR